MVSAIVVGAVVLVISVIVEGELLVEWLVRLKEIRNNLLALNQDLDKIRSEITVAVVVERGSKSLVANTRRTSY